MSHREHELISSLYTCIQVENLCTDNQLIKLSQVLSIADADDVNKFISKVNNLRHLKAAVDLSTIERGASYVQEHHDAGIKIINSLDPLYPLSLKVGQKPPAQIYVKGSLDFLNMGPGVAVVGARAVSTAGTEITRRLTNVLAHNGYSIISGLAIGVDAAAHRAALNAKCTTVAVLAHGLEEARPKQNSQLADEILANGGAWVSEYPIGRAAFKRSFVERNRIQSGLAAGSVIIEADLNSGSMTQAEFCNKNHRPLFCVVPDSEENRLNLNCRGTLELVVTKKAKPLYNKDSYSQLLSDLKASKEQLRNINHDDKSDLFE